MSIARLILALLVAALALLGKSAAFSGRKALAPSPAADEGLPADLGFTPLNSKDPKVIQLANFAIDEYNKSNNAKLVLDFVFEAISTGNSSEEGIDYGLYVAATNGDAKEFTTYHMGVFVAKNGNVKKLTSFAPLQ